MKKTKYRHLSMNFNAMENSIDIIAEEMQQAVAHKEWDRVKVLNQKLADIEITQQKCCYRHFPEVLQLETTSKCNAQCVMCSHYYEWNDCAHELSSNIMATLEYYLPYCRLMLLNGYGEPLISEYFLELLQLMKKYHVKAIVTTNLSVLTDRMLEIIPEVFAEINVSCNGYDAETYARIHRGLQFGHLEQNLDRLVRSCRHTKIALSCVVMTETVQWASEIVRFAYAHGVRKVRFGRFGVSRFIRNQDQDISVYPHYAAWHLKKAEKLAQTFEIEMVYPQNYNIAVTQEQFLSEQKDVSRIRFRYDDAYQKLLRDEFMTYLADGVYEAPHVRPDTTPISCTGICDWVAKGIYINVQGEMFTCCESEFVNYQKDWNSAVAMQIRQQFYHGLLPNFCKNCPFIINNELELLHCERKEALYHPVFNEEE